jgi:mevalonate kinase
MSKDKSTFYAKILLFGEYSILHNSMGLSIPFTRYQGEFMFIADSEPEELVFAKESNLSLARFAAHLEELQSLGELKAELDLKRLKLDIGHGLYFKSNIPQGYGIGSSGALVAGLYSRYAMNPILPVRRIKREDTNRLRDMFSQMESYFHGVSSGMDPLNCYFSKPLLIETRSDIKEVGISRQPYNEKGGIFLVNTGSPGKTGPMVDLFLESCKNDDYLSAIRQELVPLTENCIKAFVKGDVDRFFYSLKGLSKFFLSHMEPMIPKRYHKLWKHGIETGEYYLKLCGSGGGGYLLGFTEDYEKTRAFFKSQKMDLIPVSEGPQELQRQPAL